MSHSCLEVKQAGNRRQCRDLNNEQPGARSDTDAQKLKLEFPKTRGTLCWGPCHKDPTLLFRILY